MRLAICIPAFNREDYIAEALASCPTPSKVEALGHQMEVFVFDNASTDRTVELARSANPAPTVFVNSQNLGYVGNINCCLSLHDQHDWVIILHSDDLLNTDVVLATMARLDQLSDYGMVFGLNETIGGRTPAAIRDSDTIWQAGDEGVGRMQNSVPCSGVFFNSRAIAEVGALSKAYPFSGDEHYNCRVALRFPVLCTNQVVSFYRRHDENTMLKIFRKPEFIPNFLQMRLEMNAMLSTPSSEAKVREQVARTLVAQIPHCLRARQFASAAGLARFGRTHVPQSRRSLGFTARLALGAISGLLMPQKGGTS